MAEPEAIASAGAEAEVRLSEALVGEIFNGRYRILRAIGEGGLGRVYEVEHVHVGRRYALKVLKEVHRANPSAIARFRQEARLGGLLDSPWAVAVTDYDVYRGIPYLVMEYLEGESLHALLAREGALPLERALSLVLDACRGVRAAHDLGIFHRDLKPANLFVCNGSERERCKVLDFGVAKFRAGVDLTSAPPITATGGIVGTLAYMPPEQIRGEEPDGASDVYSLGAILYECLSGVRPFDANTPHALMYQILEERPTPLETSRPELPSILIRTVAAALSPERTARPRSVQDLERVLVTLLPERAEIVAGSATAVRPARGPSWTLLVACAATALIVGAGASSLLSGPSADAPPRTEPERPREAPGVELGTRSNTSGEAAVGLVLPHREPSSIASAPGEAAAGPSEDRAAGRRTLPPAHKPVRATSAAAVPVPAASPAAPGPGAPGVELDFGNNPYRSTP